MLPDKRVTAPPNRLSYSGLGEPTEVQQSMTPSSSTRQSTSKKAAPVDISLYERFSNEEMLEQLRDLEKLIKACEDNLARCVPIAKELDDKREHGWSEEEIATWNTTVSEINDYKVTLSSKTQEAVKLRYVLAERERMASEHFKPAEAAAKNALSSPIRKNTGKAPSSHSSSASQRKKQVELNLKRQLLKLQSDHDEELADIEKQMKVVTIKMKSVVGTEKESELKTLLELLELDKESAIEKFERMKKRASSESTLVNEEIDLEEEDDLCSDEDREKEPIHPPWEKFFSPQNNESADEDSKEGGNSPRLSTQSNTSPLRNRKTERKSVRFADPTSDDETNQESTQDKDSLMLKLLGKQLELMELPRNWDKKDLPIFKGRPEDWPIFKNEFYRTTPKGKINSSENAIRLRKALQGTAREAVSGLLHEPGNITKIMTMLGERFGRNQLVIDTLVAKAENAKSPDTQRAESFIEYATTVLHLISTVESLKETDYLNDRSLLAKLVDKLPTLYSIEWITWITSRTSKRENLASFGEWIESKMRVMVRISKPVIKEDSPRSVGKAPRTRGSGSVNATSSDATSYESSGDLCVCCSKGKHKLKNCFTFKKATLEVKNKIVKDNGLCFRCLESGHLKKDCTSDKTCGVDDCQATHHALLHSKGKPWKGKRPTSTGGDSEDERTDDKAAIGVSSNAGAVQGVSSKPLSIVKIRVKGPKGTKRVYAMLDSGADTTLIDHTLAKSLGISGSKITHNCRGIGGKRIVAEAEVVTFVVAGNYKAAKEYNVEKAVTMDDLGLAAYTQNATEAKNKWNYLKRAKLEDFQGVKPQILIGEDNPFLTAHRELLQGNVDDPMAKRTVLGWVLAGRKLGSDGSASSINLMTTEEGEYLNNLMKSCFSVDTFGIYPHSTEGSVEDRRAIQILEDTVRKSGDQWECGLLWRDETIKFPETKREAVGRLMSMERRMQRDSVFSSLYHSKIEEYERKGYITELSLEEAAVVNDKTFYIPHFGVFNVNKPGKLRLVFDAACKSSGVCLNDALLTGPDLIRPITSVLMNFRLHNIAINGDIKDMFHRVLVRESDRDSQRFLWRDRRQDKEAPIKTYVMNVLIFGACSSPSSAIHVKNRNAQEFVAEYPEAVRAILEDQYSDDCLTGAQTVGDAIKLRSEISQICAAGNFYLKKWLSNSKEVLASIPAEDRAVALKNFGDKMEIPTERVLGMWWNPEEDIFTFKTNFKKVDPTLLEGRRPTKREASRLLMSVFDPLGFIANFKVKGLILLQRTWRSGIDWDDELPEEIYQEWKVWVDMLKETVNIRVPRLYSYDIHLATNIQLHTLVDASEEACSSVCYLRVQVGEVVSLAFIASKTKVAPTKKLTIPRLELLAAVLGACLADTITKELRVKLNGRYFWSDSKTVLMWIRTVTLRYKEFVANRINRIHLLSNVSEWRWVPTKDNVADQGTRLKSVIELNENSTWLKGPDFLLRSPESWPTENKNETVPDEDCEVRRSACSTVIGASTSLNGTGLQHDMLVNMERFSSFSRMRRAQAAVVLALRHWIRKTRKEKSQAPWTIPTNVGIPKQKKNEPHGVYMARMGKFLSQRLVSNLEANDLEEAELLLCKKVQSDTFSEDIEALSSGKLKRRSSLWRLSPVMINGGLRLGGRIGASSVSVEQKVPIIIPARHKFTELLIMQEHIRNAHQGHATVLSNLRQKYWIIEGRTAVRRQVGKCQACKIHGAKPIMPKMGDLPYYRLTAGKPPFTFTGVDLFGPLEVVVGRHREKRWVCLFTCMVTRAIHLEVVYALSTDETMMAISRFIDQRGMPSHILSDNGTNFVGAKRELRSSWEDVDWCKIKEADKFQEIKWQFSPPRSPHFGGAWERMVQSVKRVLKRTLLEKHPKDQTLWTMLKGAENIVNSRPLTYVSGDPADWDPLTPNHFLRGFASVGAGIPGEYDTDDEVLRAQWRRAQFFLDQFWKQWTKEVLPELSRRIKWHQDGSPLDVGDVVLLVDDQAPRNTWSKGIISCIFPGTDGIVRVVQVTTVDPQSGRRITYKRGVDKICPLGLRRENQDNLPDFGGRNVVAGKDGG